MTTTNATPSAAKRGRPTGVSNRNYPSLSLEKAQRLAVTIETEASGTTVSRLTLAQLCDLTPTSPTFYSLVIASRAYNLTTGGKHASDFGITTSGAMLSSGDAAEVTTARRAAVMHVPPFRQFVDAFKGKRIPADTVVRDHLVKHGKVPVEWVEDCIIVLRANLQFAGFLRSWKGNDYLDVEATVLVGTTEDLDSHQADADEEAEDELPPSSRADGLSAPANKNHIVKKVFIAHGKNRTPLAQLKEMLTKFKVPYAVAVDEPNKGRPISAKVAALMRDECSSAIFIFTADEQFTRVADGESIEVWRPSENVVYELGAASVLYDRRIVIFKEKRVSFPSDFSDLGHIEFESDQLAEKMGDLFSELVGLDILEVRAKS